MKSGSLNLLEPGIWLQQVFAVMPICQAATDSHPVLQQYIPQSEIRSEQQPCYQTPTTVMHAFWPATQHAISPPHAHR